MRDLELLNLPESVLPVKTLKICALPYAYRYLWAGKI